LFYKLAEQGCVDFQLLIAIELLIQVVLDLFYKLAE